MFFCRFSHAKTVTDAAVNNFETIFGSEFLEDVEQLEGSCTNVFFEFTRISSHGAQVATPSGYIHSSIDSVVSSDALRNKRLYPRVNHFCAPRAKTHRNVEKTFGMADLLTNSNTAYHEEFSASGRLDIFLKLMRDSALGSLSMGQCPWSS